MAAEEQSDGSMELARTAIPNIPVLAALSSETLTIERLGGLTNLVFKVSDGGQTFCLRVPGKGTEEIINRKAERAAAMQTAQADIAPCCLHFEAESGIMVTGFLDATTMSPKLFGERAGAASRAGKALKHLHDSGAVFETKFQVFEEIDKYFEVLARKEQVRFPSGYDETLKTAKEMRRALDTHPLPSRPCHCDPLCENFLDTGERMWMVDWEYCGMNDPLWDVGDLIIEAEFGHKEEEELITSYFDGAPRPDERGRVVLYKALCDLLWTLWGLIQHANGNTAEDFWTYATGRFERCQALMAAPGFSDHVAAVAAGP